ncbi:MAG: hypothetical protein IPP98_04575 [Gemmatimonadetes bacterium]|nr:hypothetical protein [Gemmatimonadota bacterium]
MYTPSAWQEAQVSGWCPPVSGKRVVVWLNGVPSQRLVVWQVVQSVEKPAAPCGGVLVWSKFGRWQETQLVAFPLKTPSVWQAAHCVAW